MRRILAFVLLVTAIAVVSLFVRQLNEHERRMERMENLHSFEFVDLYGNRFSTAEWDRKYAESIIVCFSTDCEFCCMECDEIVRNHRKLSGYNILFVTDSKAEDVLGFLSEHPIDAIPNAEIAVDKDSEFFRAAAVSSPPTTFIYDEDLKIMAKHKGTVSVEQILTLIGDGQKNNR